jgi:hypothetical protein
MTPCTVAMDHLAAGTPQPIADKKLTLMTTTTTTTTTTLFTNNAGTTETETVVRSHVDAMPDEFICPITLNVMTHPLVTRSGQNFERSAILNWLSQSKECPLTRQPMKPSDLIPNRALEARIGFWKQRQRDQKAAAATTRTVATAEEHADNDDDDEDDDQIEEDDPIHSLVACAYLPVSEEKHNEVMARAAQAHTLRFDAPPSYQTTLMDATIAQQGRPSRARLRSDHVVLATAVLPPATIGSSGSHTNARRPGETRRNFLSRILTMAHHELKEG